MHILWRDLDEDTKWEQYETYVDETYYDDEVELMTFAEYDDTRPRYHE